MANNDIQAQGTFVVEKSILGTYVLRLYTPNGILIFSLGEENRTRSIVFLFSIVEQYNQQMGSKEGDSSGLAGEG